MSRLPGWREIIEPHKDVSEGRYKSADFAADLGQASRGEGPDEYSNPDEFFRRTYITEGMRGLLVQSLRRVTGGDGSPVIQLKTPFGGGKTHSLLALYHLMKGKANISRLSGLQAVLREAGVPELPEVHTAVIVGTAENAAEPKRFKSGITANTMWGMIGAQLAESSGNMGVYDFVREADIAGVSPGSEALKNMFDACGSCLVLIDELVAYARVLYDAKHELSAGTFENLLTFIQSLTEAARISKSSLVVASIPQSQTETGEEGGRIAQRAVEQHFGRLESIWKPVTANEGFEIVRRRLFRECQDDNARDEVADTFSRMYRDNPGDFPIEARELEYRERIISCYPVHPEVFDRLYEDWTTLESFQKTRGVLRFMAAVIYELWMTNDSGALIMPGSIALNMPKVREELIRALPNGDSWNAVIDREIDGKNSVPYRMDKNIARYGTKLAARRVARTIMLGSAPASRAQAVRGTDRQKIFLGVVQPGEGIADFGDVLSALQGTLAYLYTDSSGNRFWYDTRPTLKRTAESRAMQVADYDVLDYIRGKLRAIHREKPFEGVHVSPSSSNDVPDDDSGVRLVVLGPEGEENIEDKAASILEMRGSSPRMFRNMLVFCAPDSVQLEGLKREVREYLAWQSIYDDREILTLDTGQIRQVEEAIERLETSIDVRLWETWSVVLVPSVNVNQDIRFVKWENLKIVGGIEKIAKSMAGSEAVVESFSARMLMMNLDEILWSNQDDIAIKTLWEQLCTYCYLPRLADYDVLERAVKEGVMSGYFALAEEKSEDGKYTGLKHDCEVREVSRSAYLVKQDTALAQLGGNVKPVVVHEPKKKEHVPEKEREKRKPKRFRVSVPLEEVRAAKIFHQLHEEVLQYITEIEGADTDMMLEINVLVPEGIPEDIIRVIVGNCGTMNIIPHFE